MMTPLRTLVATGALLMVSATASAQWEPSEAVAMDAQCSGIYRSQVYIDGRSTEWDAEATPRERIMQLVDGEYQYDWTGPNDASFKYWCRYNEHGLYFAVVGRDNAIVAPDGGNPGDRMQLWLELDRPGARASERLIMVEVPIWPTNTDRYATPTWGAGAGRSGEVNTARAEMEPRENGFFLEFNVPFLAIGEYPEPYAPMHFVLVQRDWDNDADIEEEVAIATSPLSTTDASEWSMLSFTGEQEIAAEARIQYSIGEETMPFGALYAQFGGAPAQDIAFVLGDYLVVAGRQFPSFSWVSALITNADTHTPVSLEARDVNGDSVAELLYRYSVRTRDLDSDRSLVQEFMTVFEVTPEGMRRLVFQEIANEIEGVGRFEMEVRFASNLISFRKPTSSTLDRSSWFDVDDGMTPDYYEAILPWENHTRVAWSLRDGQWLAERQ
jgi:hypothetical protein